MAEYVQWTLVISKSKGPSATLRDIRTRHIRFGELMIVVYLWGFYDIKFKLTQYKSKLGLIPQYTFDLREFEITDLKFGSNTTIYLTQHVTLTNYKPKPGLIPQHTKQTSLY